MRSFWEARARENPFYFVDNSLPYRAPEAERFWASGPHALDQMLGALGVTIDASDSVVEIGCGVGRLTRPIARRAADVRALDVAPRMLELAHRHNADASNVRWLLGDGASLEGIEDASADACVSFVVFQHIPDPSVTLGYVAEIGRVLRPGGWAAIQVSNDPAVHCPRRGPARRRQVLLSLVGRAPRGQGDPAWLGSNVELDDLERTAHSAGMDVERVVGAGEQFCFVRLRRRTRPPLQGDPASPS